MRKSLSVILLCLIVLIFSPGFHCGGHPPICDDYVIDSTKLGIQIPNAASNFHINDTLSIYSKISDTFITNGGNSFTYKLEYLNLYINFYKVIDRGNGPELEYATNNFNLKLTEGYYQQQGYPGYQVLYIRDNPYNLLKAGLIANMPGLYLVTFSNTSYRNYGWPMYIESKSCTHYEAFTHIEPVAQQRQYWDSLGTGTLFLENSQYQTIASRDDTHYFFVKVIP